MKASFLIALASGLYHSQTPTKASVKLLPEDKKVIKDLDFNTQTLKDSKFNAKVPIYRKNVNVVDQVKNMLTDKVYEGFTPDLMPIWMLTNLDYSTM